MNKKYIEPSIDVMELEGDELCLQASEEINTANDMQTKERENINFSDDSDWGF